MAVPRRILKYSPAVVFGLLLVAWLLSVYGVVGLDWNKLRLAIGSGTLAIEGWPGKPWQLPQVYGRVSGSYELILGELYFNRFEYNGSWERGFPILLLSTAVASLAAGPLLSFRVRLWLYLASLALVAVELAFYLRWQE